MTKHDHYMSEDGESINYRLFFQVARLYKNYLYINSNAEEISNSYFGERIFKHIPIPVEQPNTYEKFILEETITVWNRLIDALSQAETFENIYALLFFLQIISVGRKLIYRGQENDKWELVSSLKRYMDRENPDPHKLDTLKKSFIDHIHNMPDRRHLVLGESENEALCQHYGFPTDLIDFTWDANIAGFFALGGWKRYRFYETVRHPCGAIWAIDVQGDMSDALEIITLPSQVMRPTLQKGEFVNFNSLQEARNQPRINKFMFRHDENLWISELYEMSPNDNISLEKYLMPHRDPLEQIAQKYLSNL